MRPALQAAPRRAPAVASTGSSALPARIGMHAIETVVASLDVAPQILRELEEILSASERMRAARFLRAMDRDRFIVGRARLRQLLAARLGLRPDSIEFSYGSHGKPALAASLATSGLHFNLSHSEGLAVYAFAAGHEVGVDVEAVRPLPDADAIAARFFSPSEVEAYLSLAASDRPLGFFNCWTRKEAFIKAIGEGLSHPLDRFDVSLVPGEPATLLRVDDVPGERCGWALHAFSPAPGFVAAVAAKGEARMPACIPSAPSNFIQA